MSHVPYYSAEDEITHLLHISKELPAIEDSVVLQDTMMEVVQQ